MTATAADSGADMTDIQRYLILGTVTLATLLFAMTTTNSYVVLPQMQGSLSATQDQIAWTVTFNLMATAVMTPMSGWLSNRFGRRAVMLFCVAGFSAASVLSGTATTLESLIAFRVAQGVLGAPIVPVSQAIILSTFPRSRARADARRIRRGRIYLALGVFHDDSRVCSVGFPGLGLHT